jgi:phosphoribosyl-ATP pyrophosphohydrolase
MTVAVVAVTIVEKIIEEAAEMVIGVVEEQLKIIITIDL